ncbi:hypothetical protein CU043_13530 [Corynebacterium striatum]|nr:hypothetical protein [Corynebacterium striatum]
MVTDDTAARGSRVCVCWRRVGGTSDCLWPGEDSGWGERNCLRGGRSTGPRDSDAGGSSVVWLYREGKPAGQALVDALREHNVKHARTAWFVRGPSSIVKDARRYLFRERGVAKQDASISGYWKNRR